MRADDGDRSVHEHELLCMTLELSGCYDHLDLSALAGTELVVRRLQLIEESMAAGGSVPYEVRNSLLVTGGLGHWGA